MAEVSKVYSKKIPSTQQTGLGANDLMPEPPAATFDSTNLQINYNDPTIRPGDHLVQKSKANEVYQDQELIDILPEKDKTRGKQLLTALTPFSSNITWSSDGTVFINKLGLPNSNMFELFPKLFKNINNVRAIPNLSELVTAIANLGFGHLINRKLTKGLNRRYKILNQDSLLEDVHSIKRWWFIGP